MHLVQSGLARALLYSAIMSEAYQHPSGRDADRQFRFWQRWLLIASAVFGAMGAAWTVIGSFDPFGLYTGLLAQALWGRAQLTPEAQQMFEFMVVPLGATMAGYFVLAFMIVHHAFPRRERWAYWTVVTALAVWFVLDSTFSVLHGAVFNVWLVNVPCIVIMGLPLVMLRRSFARRTTDP